MTHPNPSTAVASVLVDELIRNGVRTFVVAPGSRSAPLSMVAAADDRVDLIVCIDERSAGFQAVGLGRAGTPAAVIVTSGSAVANLLPAVVEGSMANVAMIVLTADRPPELRGVGANQSIDQIGLFGRYVRSFVELGVPEDHPGSNGYWRSTVCRSVAHAFGRMGPAGPVHVNVALREPLVPSVDDGRSVAQPFQADTSGRGDSDPWSADPATDVSGPPLPDVFIQKERGLVVAGAGADVGWSDRAAAALGWPLLCESSAGARPDQTITTAHLLASTPTFADGHQPEAVLAVGRIGLSRSVAAMCRGAMTAVIDPSGWMDPTSSAQFVVNAYPVVDPDDVPQRPTGWRRRWLEAEGVAREALDAALDHEKGLTELRTARDAARGASGGVLVAASSMPIRDLDVVLETGLSPVVSNRGASGIDGFVSTALGVARARDGVVALAGDLSMLHDQNGFLTTPLPSAVFIVVDNDGGGIFSFLPQARFPESFERVFGTPHGRSFHDYARLHGLEYETVEDPAALTPATIARREAGGLHLMHVRTDRQENVEAHRRVAEAVAAAIEGR